MSNAYNEWQDTLMAVLYDNYLSISKESKQITLFDPRYTDIRWLLTDEGWEAWCNQDQQDPLHCTWSNTFPGPEDFAAAREEYLEITTGVKRNV